MTLSNCTVVVRSVTTTTDTYGNETTTTEDRALDWGLIAPRSSQERTDPRTPAVITAATIMGPFGDPLNADDLLIVSDHGGLDGEWQVEGMPGHWSLDNWRPGFEVAVKRAG